MAEIELHLTRDEVEALHFHYTKHGIPATQTAARSLAAKLERALTDAGEEAKDA